MNHDQFAPFHSPRIARWRLDLNTLLAVGVCLPFLFGATMKLLHPAGTANAFASLGLPLPTLTVWLVILLELAGSAAAIFGSGRTAAIGAIALSVFTFAASSIAHGFWTFEEPARGEQANIFVGHLSISFALLWLARVKWHG
jgi:uncharacterized membrane protein YphA (DoxX/SURF4 family)